jgi:GNAT superfamily N-acetyltransferase
MIGPEIARSDFGAQGEIIGRVATVAVASDPAFDRSVADDAVSDAWPEYNHHGDVLNRYWGRLDDVFPDFQFVLRDDEQGAVVAVGHSAPVRWDGMVAGLPDGIDGAIELAFALAERRERPTTLCALAIMVSSPERGRGLSGAMLGAMRGIARDHGLGALIAPVRPSWKDRYPLTPIERYARWTREDGLPFDPWIRVHRRVGGEILRPEPRSLRITGTVRDWESWTGLSFPETGTYVFPAGLAPLDVDVDADSGRYWEPNVWMLHDAG